MDLKIIEAFCALMLGLQVIFFSLVQFQITDPWSFPALVFFLMSLILCAVGAIFGVGLCIMRKHHQLAVRLDTVVLFLMCLSTVGFFQVVYGWQSLDLTAGNDYSTDITNPPQYELSKYQRLKVKEVSPVWGFMDTPPKTLKSDADSLVFRKSGVELKIIINQVANKLNWIVVRRSDSMTTDKIFDETYELKVGAARVHQRTNLVMRVVSNNDASSVVDIRSSSPSRRRDFGFNELMIRTLADELEKAVTSYPSPIRRLGTLSQRELVK
jgi:hypothetical protein|tara:strand:+ start:1303 stop:2109 length:807 start_codon:yes stop_codon:yes gene_type:complete